MVSIIAAVADNGAIGKNNQLLWHISEDMRYFKRLTTGHSVIMGRRTWESLGKPLPNRRNIVVSRSFPGNTPGLFEGSAEVFGTLEEAIKAASVTKDNIPLTPTESNEHLSEEQVFIIGGGEIYRQAITLAERLYLTLVHVTIPDADTFFPEIDLAGWKEISRKYFPRGENFEHPFEFVVLERK
jgi:dihydrofolate reductase